MFTVRSLSWQINYQNLFPRPRISTYQKTSPFLILVISVLADRYGMEVGILVLRMTSFILPPFLLVNLCCHWKLLDLMPF